MAFNQVLKPLPGNMVGKMYIPPQASFGQQLADLKGYYFNQPLPGDSAVVFAPGIFSLADHMESKIVFSPDGKECYFGVVKIEDNKASYLHQSAYAIYIHAVPDIRILKSGS